MLIIGDVLVSDDVVAEAFACNLDACRGACCWEGEYGAPVNPAEHAILADIYPTVKPYLTQQGQAVIEEEGLYVYTADNDSYATPLLENGACAYLTWNKDGIALCGIERAYRDGKIDWPKPISCHLYPIRVKAQQGGGFEALNYDRWDICAAACKKGAAAQIRIFEFAKDALIRKYGEAWYDELVAAVKYQEKQAGKA